MPLLPLPFMYKAHSDDAGKRRAAEGNYEDLR